MHFVWYTYNCFSASLTKPGIGEKAETVMQEPTISCGTLRWFPHITVKRQERRAVESVPLDPETQRAVPSPSHPRYPAGSSRRLRNRRSRPAPHALPSSLSSALSALHVNEAVVEVGRSEVNSVTPKSNAAVLFTRQCTSRHNLLETDLPVEVGFRSEGFGVVGVRVGW